MNSFEEWWFGTQFDKGYWDANGYRHTLEYSWAKLAWDARGDLKELEGEDE